MNETLCLTWFSAPEGASEPADPAPEDGETLAQEGNVDASSENEEPRSSAGEPPLDAVSDALSMRLAEAEAGRVRAGWEKESESLREIYPSFSLEREVRENPDFRALLRAGLGLRRAYEAVHLPEILTEAMRYAAMEGGRRAAKAREDSAVRVRENAVLERAASVEHRSVRDLSEQDVLKILDSVGKGAKIRF